MFQTGEPYSRPDLIAAFRRLDLEGGAYLASIPGSEFFEPQGGAWSPAEHARHLAKAARPFAQALRMPRIVIGLRFGLHRAPSLPFAELRQRYLAQLAAGGTAGRFTPSERPRPANAERGRDEVLAGWHEANLSLEGAVSGWAERALDRYRLPHPLLGPLTVREMMAFSVYHTAHHLRRVAERRTHSTGGERAG